MYLKRLAPVAIVGVLAIGLAACGDDDDATPATTAAPAAATTAPAMDHSTMDMDHPSVQVDGVDYAFQNVPASIKAGTKLTFKNDSNKEFHEMVVIRIPDSEKRSVADLAKLPEEESNKVFANVEPAAVLVAPPGQEGMAVVGDGTITEPGRYAVVCFIPVGADPQKVVDAMQTESSGPPDLGDGPPHISAGMHAELTVTA
jgi:uncharacterized cupredoxin-like copper-binding protein